ncbi:uncharacterized protein LOC132039567 isoform X2 [Lycium ferocissimum]|uniref:uncharacterized protein LOC132039567 isoform X2 n=1 Tax=Lycium ferocissimum TaxID=112874 RepID=UPI0028149F4A|nr:uncharacterized protein LOC132039567 isoform X2 [Lycium ferocissimum]
MDIDDEYVEGEEYLIMDESDIIKEIDTDEEELEDADDEEDENEDFDDADEEDEEEQEYEADDSVYAFTGHTGEVYTAICSLTDAKLVATGGGDNRGFIWKIGQGDSSLKLLEDHTDSVSSLAFSSDGQLLASGSVDGHIRVWDTTSDSLKGKLEGPGGEIEWVRWHPRRHMVLAGAEYSAVLMWNVGIQEDMWRWFLLSGHGGSVTCGDFTPDGKFICTGSDDATLRIWDAESGAECGRCIHAVRLSQADSTTKGLNCLAISLDSTRALTGSEDGSAHIVNIITGKVVNSLSVHTQPILCAGFSASGSWAATGGMDNKLIIWDLHTSSPRSTCEHEAGVLCLLWLGKSSYVATGCVDGKVRIWDSRSGECVRTFRGHTRAIQSLSASSDGKHLVSASYDKTKTRFQYSRA